MKRITALLLAVLMLVSLTACGGKSEPAAPAAPAADAAPAAAAPAAAAPAAAPAAAAPAAAAPAEPTNIATVEEVTNAQYTASDETLVVANKGNPTGLCHLIVTAVSANNATLSSMYDRLVNYDYENNTVAPMLAESWEQIDDTHVRFHLRKDVVSHAGDPFTASDVIFTVTQGQTGGKLSNYYSMFNLDECKAEDDYTVVLATNTVDPFFLYTLSNTPLAMIVEKSTEKDGLEAQGLNPTAATGPYKFVEWADGSYVKLERNENYWGGTPYYKNVEIRIITEPSARVMNLESGDVDIALDPDVNALAALQGDPAFTIVNLPTTNITTMYLNCSKAPFNDPNLRRAVAHGVNYQANLKIAVGGYGTITDSFLPVNNVCYTPQPDSHFHYDPEKAKQYLAQSSYPNGVEFELIYAESATFAAYAEMFQEQMNEIGLTVKLTPLASSEFDARLCAGDFDAEMINSSNPDPAVQQKYYDKRIDFNTMRGGCGYVDGSDELLALLDEGKVTVDVEARKAVYDKIQKIIGEECPAIPLYSPNKQCAMDSDIQGLTLTEFCDINWSRVYK